MTTAGMVMMTVSLLSVLSLVTFSVTRVLSLPPVDEDSVKGPLEIDTKDTDDAD